MNDIKETPEWIYVDALPDDPVFLLKDDKGLYICKLEPSEEGYREKDRVDVSAEEARLFIADSFRRSMAKVSESYNQTM